MTPCDRCPRCTLYSAPLQACRYCGYTDRAACDGKPPAVRVDVYDVVNQDRLLGSIERPSLSPAMSTHSFRMAAFSPMSSFDYDFARCAPIAETNIRTVEFGFIWKSGPDEWTKVRALVTSSPLAHLTLLPGFRLPTKDK